MESSVESAQYVGVMPRNPILMILEIVRALRPILSMHGRENVSKTGITGPKGLTEEKNRKEKQKRERRNTCRPTAASQIGGNCNRELNRDQSLSVFDPKDPITTSMCTCVAMRPGRNQRVFVIFWGIFFNSSSHSWMGSPSEV